MPHGHEQQQNEHDQHDGASQRELPDLAPQVLDLRAAGPDTEPGLIGAREMPYQQPGDGYEDNGPHNESRSGGFGPGASTSPHQAAACQMIAILGESAAVPI